jgi:hypothetical protein
LTFGISIKKIEGSIQFDETGFKSLKNLWVAHLKNLGKIALDLKLPQDIHEIIQEINSYLIKQRVISKK